MFSCDLLYVTVAYTLFGCRILDIGLIPEDEAGYNSIICGSKNTHNNFVVSFHSERKMVSEVEVVEN